MLFYNSYAGMNLRGTDFIHSTLKVMDYLFKYNRKNHCVICSEMSL